MFRERLRLATAAVNLHGKKVLDIGAGTGALFDYLAQKRIACEYFACDLSASMLAQSHIPAHRRFAGQAHRIDWPVDRFDCIFLLGVSNYMTQKELSRTFRFIASRLVPGGKAVMTFANKASIDWQARRWLGPLLRRAGYHRGVLGKGLSITACRKNDLDKLIPGNLQILQSLYFNPVLPPLERLFPQEWVRIARRLQASRPEARWKAWISADFMAFISKEG
jgi:SAM-dependent methyltransferase